MAITLANQSAGVLGTAANTWSYTLGFTPTVGNKLVLYILTPASAGALAGPWAVSGPSAQMAFVGQRTGVTGSYNVNMLIGDINSTSTSIGMFFNASALHGIIAAEFTGWTNITPLATLTNTTTFTSGVAFSNVAITGGRDFDTAGTNRTGIRAISFTVNALANVSISAFDETSISGTPNTTITNAPGGTTWFSPAPSSVTATGTSLAWSTRNWTSGPSGGNQIAFAAATGSSLTGISVASGPAWTQLTNPAGISTSILRCFYKSGTGLNNISNTTTSSASSAMTTLGQIFGEKSLVVNNVSDIDSFGIGGLYSTRVAFGDSQGLTDANAGSSSFWTSTTSPIPKIGNFAGFTSGSTTIWRTITNVTFVPIYSTYFIQLNSTIPQIGGTSTYASFILANSLVAFNTTYVRNPSDTLGINENVVVTKQNSFTRSDTVQFNSFLDNGENTLEVISNSSGVIKDYKVVFDQYDISTGAPDGSAIMGDTTLYIASNSSPVWNVGDNIVLWNSQTYEFSGPFAVKTFAGPLPKMGGTSTVYAFDFYGEVLQGQMGSVEYDSVILLDSTSTMQDLFAVMPVQPYVNTYIDPVTGDSAPFQGGFF